MNKSVKAALLSGLVFPGLGQIYLKRRRRAAFLILIMVSLLGVLIGMITAAVLQNVEKLQEQGPVSTGDAQALAASLPITHTPFYKMVLIALICCWLFAVIDAYRAGKA